MIVDLEKLEEMKYLLSSTGAVLSDLSRQNDEYFNSIYLQTEKLTELMKSVISQDELHKVSSFADTVMEQMSKVDSILDTMSSISTPEVDKFSESVNKLSDHFSAVSGDLKDKKNSDKRKQLKVPKKEKRKPNKEVESVKFKLKGFLNSLKLPVLGAVGAGLIGLIAYGVAERQRLQAEAGEVSDILVMASDGHLKKLQGKAQRTVAAVQESLQKFYGISRQEYQAALSEMVKGGIATAEWSQSADRDLGLVGKNFHTLSLGVDKLLNIAGGSTARDMVDNQHRFGMSLKESTDYLNRSLVLGTTTGLGYSKFYESVKDASVETEKLGFNVQTTAEFMANMQEHFDSLYIPKFIGAALINKGIKGISSGIQGMSEGWKTEIAESLGMGTGLEALINFQETWSRLSENKGDPEALQKFVTGVVKKFVEYFKDEYTTKHKLQQSDIGMSAEGATLAWEVYQNSLIEKDPTKSSEAKEKAAEASKEAFKNLRNSYKTEAQKRTQWERDMNKWMKHISHIGMGLMGLVANALSKMILFWRYVPEMFGTFFEKGGSARRDAIIRSIEKTVGNTKSSTDLIERGFKGLVDAGISLMGDAFGQSIKNLKSAFSTDLSIDTHKAAVSDREAIRSNMGIGRGTSPGVVIAAPPTVRTVYVPQSGPAVASVEVPEYEAAKAAYARNPYGPAKLAMDYWKGTEPLQIVSYGVDDSGSIHLALTGQCPRCGLDYDEGFDEGSYMDDWDKATGIKFKSTKKPGESQYINLDSSDAMSRVKELEMSKKRKQEIQESGQELDPLDPALKAPLKVLAAAYPGKAIKLYSSERVGEEGNKGVHATGKALDLGVEGVSKEDVFRTLYEKGYGTKKGGLGYYTNTPFVHVDVRKKHPWLGVDTSKVGEKSSEESRVSNPEEWIDQNLYKSEDTSFKAPVTESGL